jgi:hypothetical protein
MMVFLMMIYSGFVFMGFCIKQFLCSHTSFEQINLTGLEPYPSEALEAREETDDALDIRPRFPAEELPSE